MKSDQRYQLDLRAAIDLKRKDYYEIVQRTPELIMEKGSSRIAFRVTPSGTVVVIAA